MVDLDEYKRLMSERDHHALRTEDERRSTLLGLADAVPDLVEEVERLRAALDRDRDELMVNATENEIDGQVQRTDGGTVFIRRLARPDADHSQLVPTATIAVEPPTLPAVCTRKSGLPTAPSASAR